jgi:hypothetical protein
MKVRCGRSPTTNSLPFAGLPGSLGPHGENVLLRCEIDRLAIDTGKVEVEDEPVAR